MGGNMILSDAIERLSIENVKTGETFAAITHGSVDTTSDDIVVRLRLSANSDSPYSVKSASTAALVKELIHRDGIKTVKVAPYNDVNIACTGPVIVLVVED